MKNPIIYLLGVASIALATQVHAVAENQGGCALSDLVTSTVCVGVYDPGNDNGVNTVFTDQDFIDEFGTGWQELVKLEDPTWNVANSLDFSLTGQGGTSGDWSVDANAWDGFSQGEVIGILKAGTNAAAYEIDLTQTSGNWDVSSTAWDGSGLSHFSFWSTSDSDDVPEPSIVALLSLGILALGISARRKM